MNKKYIAGIAGIPIALFRVMNIFTTSIPDFNPDQFMIDRPAPSAPKNGSTDSSRFAELVNDAERPASRHEDKRKAYSIKENERLLKTEPKKHDNEEKTVQSENRTEGRQGTDDTKAGHQVSNNDNRNDESGTEVKGSEEKNEVIQDRQVTQSDLADNDVKGDEAEDTDKFDNESIDENPQTVEQVIASLTINEDGDQVVGTGNMSEEANLSEVKTDTETIKPDVSSINQSSNKGDGPSIKGESGIIDSTTDNVAASDKQQGNTANDRGHINNESDEILSLEQNSEDDQPEQAGSDNKGSNKNNVFGKNNIEEIPDEFDLNEELKEKVGLSSTKEIPDRYAKKTVTDPADFKQVQSQMNITDSNAMDELNKIGSDQDGMLFKNMQSFAYNGGINNAFKGFSDTSLNSLESIDTNTTMSNAELAQNQGMTMAGNKAGAGLLQGNAARAAGFSELLSQVVYVAKGKNKLDVKINHEEFGKLKINVSMEKGMLNIHVNASEKVVREFLESNVHNIIESLSKDGVSVGGFSVALKDHKDNPEKKFLMDSGLSKQYEHIPVAAVHSNRGLVNVFA